MICPPCQTRNHEGCQSVSCCCGHQGSTVRALTHQERHEFAAGRRTEFLVPRAPDTPGEIAGQEAGRG
jgi:hypothetical protein